MGQDLTRPYRPTVRSTYNSGRATPKFRGREPKKSLEKPLGRKMDNKGAVCKKPKKKASKKIPVNGSTYNVNIFIKYFRTHARHRRHLIPEYLMSCD